MKYKITFSVGIAGRIKLKDTILDNENPRFGFYWWFWLPSKVYNNGSIFRDEIVDFHINWFCFWIGFTLWPK